MKSSKYLRLLSLLLLSLAATRASSAATIPVSGMFSADDSSYTYSFTTTASQIYTFATTSYSAGGFLPVLTLFNAFTGKPIDNAGSGFGDVSLNDSLSSGSYVLYLTEFPNVANGNLSDGFLFTGSPAITGDLCGVGGKFLNTVNCTQRTGNYALSITNNPVPEPPTWLLVLPPAVLAFGLSRRYSA